MQKTEATKQRKTACSSCPWISDGDRTVHFDPDILRRSVVDAMGRGSIHPCHSGGEYMCSGYLAFAEKNLRGGADALQMVRISARLGMFDYGLINTNLNVFKSIKAMLADHRKRMRRKF